MDKDDAKELADLAGMPATVTIGGQEYRFTQMSAQDHAWIIDWIRVRRARDVRRLGEVEGWTDEQILTESLRARAAPILDAEWREVHTSFEGQCYLLWLAMRPHHAALTYQAVVSLFRRHPEAFPEAIAVTMPQREEGGDDEANPPETETATSGSAGATSS